MKKILILILSFIVINVYSNDKNKLYNLSNKKDVSYLEFKNMVLNYSSPNVKYSNQYKDKNKRLAIGIGSGFVLSSIGSYVIIENQRKFEQDDKKYLYGYIAATAIISTTLILIILEK